MPVIGTGSGTVLQQGTIAARPAASASNTGYHYFASDLNGGTLFQSDGASWVQIAAAVTQTASGVGAVANAGGAPSLQVGLDAAKPAAGTAGRLYVATDTTIVYEDSGTAWIEVATAAPLWASVVGKPATFAPSAHESTHLSGGSDAIAGLSQSQIAVDATEAATNDTLAGSLLANLDRLRYQLAQLGTGAWNTLCAMVQLSPTAQQTGTINVSGEVQGSDFKPGGVTGASAAARYHAATATGHPTTGTWQVGDIVPDQTGTFWFCTVAGTPGTWVQVGGTGGGTGSSTLAADTDVAITSPVGGQVLGYSDALSKWVNQPVAGVAATTSTSQLGADVAMTTANTYYDGPTITLSPGTWLLIGSITVYAAGAPTHVTAKLWDGTTVYVSSEQTTGASGYKADPTVTAIVTTTSTTTYKISAAADAANTTISAAAPQNGAGNNASYLTAIQLSGNPVGQQAPAVRASNSATVPTTAGAFTTITFDTTDFDQGTSVPQHSTSSNTSRLVCQQAGVYQITAHVHISGTTTETAIQLVLNGSTIIGYQDQGASGGATVTTLYRLNVGDYVEVQLYETVSAGSAGAEHFAAYSPTLMMARIDSGPGAVQPNTKVQLDWSANTDVNAVALTANTWTDVFSNQTFVVDDPNSVIEVSVGGYAQVYGASGVQGSSRLVVDSAGVPVIKKLGGQVMASVSIGANILAGCDTVSLTGLSAGVHTVKVQVYASGAGASLYCRASSTPDAEFLNIRVLERKQSVSPPSSTPAPAVRAYNSVVQSLTSASALFLSFDTNRFDQGTSTPQHSTSSNPSRLVCQQAGVYQITGYVSYAGSSSGIRQTTIKLNGTTNIDSQLGPNNGANAVNHVVTALWYLNVGDYVVLEAYQDTGGALNATSAEFMMARVDSGGQGFVPIPMVKTANYVCMQSDSMIVAGANGLTITLPPVGGRAPGLPLVVSNDNFTGTIIACSGTDTIKGTGSYGLFGAYESVTLVGDGISKWRII